MEQGLKEFKAEKQKEKNSVEAESLVILVTHLLPLTDSFGFNLFFLILPDVIFNNTPLLFL